MNLHETLDAIAAQLKLDAGQLKLYAVEDRLGGYHHDPVYRRYEVGAIWGVEGQILYALIRALKPQNVLELGAYRGCSGDHMRAALEANGSGEFTSVDSLGRAGAIMDTAQDFMQKTRKQWDFIFEDTDHARSTIAFVWGVAKIKLSGGGLMISHDSLHPLAGEDIRNGIMDAGLSADTKHYLTAPSDCGMSIWQKPIPPTELQLKAAAVKEIQEKAKTEPVKEAEKKPFVDPFPTVEEPETEPEEKPKPKPKRKRGRPPKKESMPGQVSKELLERGGLVLTKVDKDGEVTEELVG